MGRAEPEVDHSLENLVLKEGIETGYRESITVVWFYVLFVSNLFVFLKGD